MHGALRLLTDISGTLFVLDSLVLSCALCSMATKKSQEASSSTSQFTYHVFLSFKGQDTCKTFIDHLSASLDHVGYRTFRDDDMIERGEGIESELEKAFRESRISIIVFSKNYASSIWCLEELVMILKRRSSTFIVLPVFYDVDPSEVRNRMGSFKEAFTRHEEEIERGQGSKGKVEEWRAALKQVANIAGMNLQNLDDGDEARFIRKIVKVGEGKLSRTVLDVEPYPIGIYSRAKNIQHWLEDWSIDNGIVAICGMGGIGKTTMAKFLYNWNFLRFEGSSFIENVRETSRHQDGLLRLQRQLVSDILRGRKVKINSVDEGTIRIKDALCCKRVLVVLDDVDELDHLDTILGLRDWIFPGSRIIITTRRERLIRGHNISQRYWVEKLDHDESLELFCWHAFGQSYPVDGYIEVSESVVHRCDGLPLAIKVLGSSLSGKSIAVWKSQIKKLKAIPYRDVLEKLKISYESLQDYHDQSLFLHLACFFVGIDKDCATTILDRCEFYTMVGIQNLIDRCLVRIDEHNNVEIHQSLQEMGREIARQKSPKEPGERSILYNHKDSFNILRENTGTSKVEGLILDMHILKQDESTKAFLGVNRKRRFEEFFDKPSLSSLGSSLKRHSFSIFSSNMVAITPTNSNQVALDVDGFARLCNLKILQLNQVQVSGPYKNFPNRLRWLSWGGFPLQSIPRDFPLESLVALDMHYSSVKNIWEGSKVLPLKILNLSHSHELEKMPDFARLPNLERLVLEDCPNLLEVHESVVLLEKLVLLNLKDCISLRKLPRSIDKLKLLEKLDISGCFNLEELPKGIRDMESLTVLNANGTSISTLLFNVGEVKAVQSSIWPWLQKPRKSDEISWVSLPRSLVELSLTHCNLSNDTFPKDFGNLSSLNFLDLSHNPIHSLPDCINGLNGLQRLHLTSCYKLRTIMVLQKLHELLIGSDDSLEKISFPSASHKPKRIRYTDKCDSLIEFMPYFKLEPIGNVDTNILSHMGLFDMESIGKPIVDLTIGFAGVERKLPLQGCHESQIFCTYLPRSKVPTWFNFVNRGSSISFIVPSHLNFVIRGLSMCSLYGRLFNEEDYVSVFAGYYIEPHTIVSNTTKNLIWSHSPTVFGIPEAGEDMLWYSYWKFENQLEVGDELNISVTGGKLFQIKEVGVHVVYEEREKRSTNMLSTSVEEVRSKQISPYGNAVPGNVIADGVSPKLYQLGYYHGKDWKDCKYCPPLCPQSWTLDAPKRDLA